MSAVARIRGFVMRTFPWRAFVGVAVLAGALASAPRGMAGEAGAPDVRGPSEPVMFQLDDQKHPRVTVSWPTTSGEVVSLTGERAYLSPDERTPLGRNIECFVAAGGLRVDAALGHPNGVVVRVGFYKTRNAALFFDDIAEGASVTIELTGVAFTAPGVGRPETVILHSKYMPEDLLVCGLGDKDVNMWNTADPVDDFRGKITANNGRRGVFAPGGAATATLRPEADGSVTLVARVPYRLFKHVRDPWLRSTPGTFMEPNHFHVEFEALPRDGAEGIVPPAAGTAEPAPQR